MKGFKKGFISSVRIGGLLGDGLLETGNGFLDIGVGFINWRFYGYFMRIEPRVFNLLRVTDLIYNYVTIFFHSLLMKLIGH